MPVKSQPTTLQAERHIKEALMLVGRGNDHVQQAIQQLAFALKSLIKELNG